MDVRRELICLGLAATIAAVAGCSEQSPMQPTASAAATAAAAVPPAMANSAPPPFVFPDGCCYYEGTVVRTVVPPAANPRTGRDNFYGIVNGVPGQKGVVAVAPGDREYHGGHWRFYAVTFTGAPYLLTSEAAVRAAEEAGDVTVVRNPDADFKCPIQR